MKDSISKPTWKTFRRDFLKRRSAEPVECRSKRPNFFACLTGRSGITCRSTTFRRKSSDFECDFLRGRFPAQDGILHREIVPPPVTARSKDVAGFQIVDQVL